MWAKFKLIEPVDYTQGDLVRENSAEETGIIWSRQYDIVLHSGLLNGLVKRLGNSEQFVIEFPLNEDQGNIGAPPCTRMLTNIDDEIVIVDFYYENPGANVYFAREDLVLFHYTDFKLKWSVALLPNETIILDATVPTRINQSKKILWREWRKPFGQVKNSFKPWLGASLIEDLSTS